ncbi:MAG: SpoIIE family protein phosphatase [Desulfitobacterium hafniense]|nr:SpoIIE family protein phosphatase [Desulfitobacterium hafniense]
MADWATLKVDNGLRKERLSLDNSLLPIVLGGLLARGSIAGVHPFGIAFGAALILNGGRRALFGVIGTVLGILSVTDLTFALEYCLIMALVGIIAPNFRKRKAQGAFLGIITSILTISILMLNLMLTGIQTAEIIKIVLLGVLAGGFTFIFWFGLSNQEAVWRGDFTGEPGVAWLLILVGILSGLQDVQIGPVNAATMVLTFFVLFVAARSGAGSAAGVGAMLGFLPHLSPSTANLMTAGIYGLTGFAAGAFRRFGKIGLTLSFTAVTLMLTVFWREDVVYSQLLSSGLGLLLFLFWPTPEVKRSFLKTKPVPEVETTVTKVKTLAEIFDQIALSCHAAEAEAFEQKPEVPELMNILVERVCKTCPTIGVCWEREFYKTYHYLLNMFALVEREDVKVQDIPVDWKRHCGRTKEMLLGIQFIIEHEKSQEVWRKRVASNREALARQFQSVSQVIGHLAKELNARNNFEPVNTSGIARRRRHFIDVGVAAFVKSGNGLSGDNYASIAFSPVQHAFVLSDGMGVGEAAAKMSATALTLLEQLLSTGFEPEGAIQALNSILVLRSPEESFVTIDMAVFDLETDKVRLIKAGASPSYLRTAQKVQVFSTSSLPAGILNHIEVPVLELEVKDEELLILATDGIEDVLRDGTDWLKVFLEKTNVSSSQELADMIACEARKSSQDNMLDDGVVMVIRKNYMS